MATRSIVRIIPSKATEQKDCSNAASRYIYLYHHWDGSPSGVGRELEHFLRGRNDGDAPDGTPTWDADSIADELMNSPSGYVRSDNSHGDVEYGYVIDCGHRTLTCYDLESGRRSIDNANEIIYLYPKLNAQKNNEETNCLSPRTDDDGHHAGAGCSKSAAA